MQDPLYTGLCYNINAVVNPDIGGIGVSQICDSERHFANEGADVRFISDADDHSAFCVATVGYSPDLICAGICTWRLTVLPSFHLYDTWAVWPMALVLLPSRQPRPEYSRRRQASDLALSKQETLRKSNHAGKRIGAQQRSSPFAD